jgi:hypothetical protein
MPNATPHPTPNFDIKKCIPIFLIMKLAKKETQLGK